MIRQMAMDFAKEEVLPIAAKIDHEHSYPKDLIRKMGDLGFMGALASAKHEGSEMTATAYALSIEEIASACASTAIIMSVNNSLFIDPLNKFANKEQQDKYIKDVSQAKKLGCFALSEPGTGSDAAALTCKVKLEGDKYVINGSKNWITNAPVADYCILFAMQDSMKGNKGITAFVHSLKLPGIEIGKKEDKLGICGSPTASISYKDVELSKENLLGKEYEGFKIAMSTLNGGRIGVAAQAVGIAKAALRDAMNYAKERKTFGKLIYKHQTLQNYFADMITKLTAARYLTIAAARSKDNNKDYVMQSAMAKLFASEVAMDLASKGIQIHGGYGYVKEYPAERHFRDAKITEIYEGTSEIQRLVIASELFKS
ncbi:UNVERIFIED_CONTAM: hypothetical protein GTU68_013059 [Idotea baltica]|nr:hypothetical protein [Idotea baltica]